MVYVEGKERGFLLHETGVYTVVEENAEVKGCLCLGRTYTVERKVVGLFYQPVLCWDRPTTEQADNHGEGEDGDSAGGDMVGGKTGLLMCFYSCVNIRHSDTMLDAVIWDTQ